MNAMHPEVSVVMAVFNGAAELPATLRSVRSQQGCEFEMIVIDDGSTDGSAALLDEWASRDARLRVTHQRNTGLTLALSRGCALARGTFIARQDCGDVSLPGRLARQCAALRANPGAVLVAGGATFLGPAGELLFTRTLPGSALQEALSLEVPVAGPPHHGATMFRRDAYAAVGGYRAAFHVAQDIDLWLRLAEAGACFGETEVAYEATLDARGISAQRRPEQVRLVALAEQCARARRRGEGDAGLLASAPARPRPRRRGSAALQRARFYYFVGCCLAEREPSAARDYWRRALREHPLHLRSAFRLLSWKTS